MTEATNGWRDRWATKIECRDCGARFEVLEPDCSVDRVGGHARLVLLHCPEVCPECKNLKAVG